MSNFEKRFGKYAVSNLSLNMFSILYSLRFSLF